MRYYDRNIDRVKYVICKTKEEFNRIWKEMTESLIQGVFFRETLSHRGLIIYKIRDYKQEGKDEIGCVHCGQLFKKKDIAKEEKRTDGTVYQLAFKCPKCNIDLGWEWIG